MPIYTDPTYLIVPTPSTSGTSAFINSRANYFEQAFQSIGIALDDTSKMQPHHIIPLAMIRGVNTDPDVTQMVVALTNAGLFSILDGHQNLVWLPSTSSNADYSGLGQHGGFDAVHRNYNAQVEDALLQIEQNDFPNSDPADGNQTQLAKARAISTSPTCAPSMPGCFRTCRITGPG